MTANIVKYDKSELLELVLNNCRRTPSESAFSKKFANHYKNIINIRFPKDFTFFQKLYHYLHDDLELKLGICPVCKNRCNFIGIRNGYNCHCCTKCSTLDKSVQNKSKKTRKERYGDENYNNTEKYKETCLNKFGYTNPSKSNYIKEKKKKTCLMNNSVEFPQQSKKVQEKTKHTNLKKYNTEWAAQSNVVKYKIKQTNLKKYGNCCSLHGKDIVKKTKNTLLKKYNADNASKSNIVKEKRKQTWTQIYGTPHPWSSETVKEKNKQTWLSNYDVDHPWKSDMVRKKCNQTSLKKYGKPFPAISVCEMNFFEYLSEIYTGQIIQNDRTVLESKEIDIYLPDLKLGFEFNGDYWHMNPLLYKSNDYNQNIKKYAYEIWNKDLNKIESGKTLGITILTVWEYDWKHKREYVCNQIKNIINEHGNKYI